MSVSERRISLIRPCAVSMVPETRNASHVQQIKDALKEKGYSLLDE